MRLSNIAITGFRGFTNETLIPLNADFVLLTGPNGVGKTSFMDAILWCVTGAIPRLEAVGLKRGEDYVSNKYAATLPEVELTFLGAGGSTSITRRGTGRDQRLVVVLPNEETLTAEDASLWLSQQFNPEASGGRGFQRAFVLQQDDIREFLTADPGERYRYLSYLAGVEDAELLDRELKSELKKVRELSREVSAQLETEQSRLSALDLSRTESEVILERVDVQEEVRLSSAKKELLPLLPSGAVAANAALDDVIAAARDHLNHLEERSTELHRREEALKIAVQQIAETEHDPAALPLLLSQVQERESVLRDLEEQVTLLEEQARDAGIKEDRRKQLASLALEQLDGDRCPVCDQEFDKQHVVSHLRQFLDGESRSGDLRHQADELRQRAVVESRALSELRRTVTKEERAAQALQQAIQRRETERDALESTRLDLITLLGSDTDAVARLTELRLAVQSATAATESVKQRKTVRRQLEEIDKGLVSQREAVARLTDRRRQLADKVSRADSTCSWLGERLVEAAAKVLKSATPLVNELYARLDIHPTLRRFDFHAERHYQSGKILPWLYDDEADIEGNAGHLLSSAQLNVLAVCLFFSMNLIQRWSPLDVVVMDDPVQSMDDVHVLGLADTLRSARDRRQIIVSTHDVRVAELLWRKLRPMKDGTRNLRLEFTDWSPTDGPNIKVEERRGAESTTPLEVVGLDASLFPPAVS